MRTNKTSMLALEGLELERLLAERNWGTSSSAPRCAGESVPRPLTNA